MLHQTPSLHLGDSGHALCLSHSYSMTLLQPALLQIPLSLLMAIIYGTRYDACSENKGASCVAIAAAPAMVFLEVSLLH